MSTSKEALVQLFDELRGSMDDFDPQAALEAVRGPESTAPARDLTTHWSRALAILAEGPKDYGPHDVETICASFQELAEAHVAVRAKRVRQGVRWCPDCRRSRLNTQRRRHLE